MVKIPATDWLFYSCLICIILVSIYFILRNPAVLTNNRVWESLEDLKDKLTQKTELLKTASRELVHEREEHQQTEKNLEVSNEQLRLLSARIQEVREEERTRISRDLHDELGQQLTVLKMELSWLNKKINGKQVELTDKIAFLLNFVDEAIHSVRRISFDLRPGSLDHLGLIAALEEYCAEIKKRTGLTFTILAPEDDLNLPDKLSTEIFRIIQESITNVIRHAQATAVTIEIKSENKQLYIEVKDNGKGITEDELAHSKSLGLLGMRERAHLFNGDIQIRGIPGGGTTVTLVVPVPDS